MTANAPQFDCCEPGGSEWLSDWLQSFAEAESSHRDCSTGSCGPIAVPSQDRLRAAKKYLDLMRRVWIDEKECHDPLDPFLPAHLGRFTLVKMLGQGAHGNVYQAIDTLLGREVALKVPRAESLASPELRRRFLREARAVAALSHPNLVTIYEAGASGPIHYIASNLCTGPNLSQWIAQQDQAIAIRVAARLVATLAEAVAYVHSQGVVHRDLKPSNVLLEPLASGSPPLESTDSLGFTPKLADFGLAKYLYSEADATASGDILGTPAYMAPEQASGRVHEVGPAADIYALGAILYHLLTGRVPFQAATKLETLRQVIDGAITPPKRLRPDLPRDIEAVCLKCMEHEADRRYKTAHELAQDLWHFLDGEPVLARRASTLSRLAKWSRRRPLVAGLTYSLSLVVLVAFAALTWQWRWADQQRIRAEQNFLDAHGAIHEFQTILYEGSKYDDPRFQQLRLELLEAGLGYYRRFLLQRPDDPALLSDFAQALFETAVINSTRGSKSEALSLLCESLPVWENLTRAQPDVPEHRFYLAKTHHHIGLLQQTFAELAAAQDSCRRALAIGEDLVKSYPDVLSYRNQFGSICYQYAEQCELKERWDECLKYAQQSQQIFESLIRRRPDRTEYQRMLAASQRLEGNAHLGAGRRARALECFERARDACEQLVDRNLGMPESAKMLAHSLLSIGSLQSEDDKPSAMRTYERCMSILQPLVRLDPSVTAWRRDLAACHFHVAVLMDQDGQTAQQQEHLKTALEIRKQLIREDPQVIAHRRNLGQTMLELAKIDLGNGKLDDAIHNLQSAYPLIAQWVEHYPNNISRQFQLSLIQQLIGDAQSKKENPIEAIRAYRDAAIVQRGALQASPGNVSQRARLAQILVSLASQLRRLHKYGEARSEYAQAIEQLDSIQNECGLTEMQQRIRETAREGLVAAEREMAPGA
jgi:serine/threonine protein kinase/tetratricopeptide (TPR) repeat protein